MWGGALWCAAISEGVLSGAQPMCATSVAPCYHPWDSNLPGARAGSRLVRLSGARGAQTLLGPKPAKKRPMCSPPGAGRKGRGVSPRTQHAEISLNLLTCYFSLRELPRVQTVEHLNQAGRISRWPLATITGSQPSGSKCGESSCATLRGYGCLDASGAEACQKTTHVQSSWGGSEGERRLPTHTARRNFFEVVHVLFLIEGTAQSENCMNI